MLLAAVIAGLAAGIAFIFAITIMADAMPSAIWRGVFVRSVNDLDEVKTFREVYPRADVTAFFNPSCLSCRPPIVEHWHQDESKYASVRIILHSTTNEVTFIQVLCTNLENTFDQVEIHGQNLERQDILDLLQDPHCPRLQKA